MIKNHKGFTFIEVVLSIVVLTLGVALLMQVFPASLQYFQKSKYVTQATFYAQTKMAELQNLGSAAPDSQFGEYPVPDNTNFKYKVEKLPLWGKYKEIRVSVNRQQPGQVVAPVYAAVSGIAADQVNYVDFTVIDSGGTPSPSNGVGYYYFVADAKNKCIWWMLEVVRPGVAAGVWYPAGGWQKLGVATPPASRGMTGIGLSAPAAISYPSFPNSGSVDKMFFFTTTIYPAATYYLPVYISDYANGYVWKGNIIFSVNYKEYPNSYFDRMEHRIYLNSTGTEGGSGWTKVPLKLP